MKPPRRKLIVVSNRGPVSYARDAGGGRVARRGGGGLVTALGPLVSRCDVTWIASAMTGEDRNVAAEAGGASFDETGRDGSPYRLRLIAHDPAAFDLYYNVYANPTLWFLQHRLWELAGLPGDEAWAGYQVVNERFAEAVVEELDADAATAVWFHDYHLYLAPRAVRRARPDATLAHFVHIPWPEAEHWSVLPASAREAIHDGLLANDIVGFHTHRWRENFVASAGAVLGAAPAGDDLIGPGSRRTLVTAHPISVDTAEFDRLSRSAAVLDEERDLERLRCERMVLRVDRTDPSKNIVRGFRAFELYLERHPESHGRVGMVALLDPSRQAIPQYTTYLEEVEAAVRDVNRRFGVAGWEPIRLEVGDDFPRSVAAYLQYDVLLVNAVCDGLNLVAKEAPLVNARDGVVILSRDAGAYEELAPWVLAVDPLDVPGQADSIHAALELPAAERHARAEAIQAHVRAHDLESWIAVQMADLDRVSQPAPSYDRGA